MHENLADLLIRFLMQNNGKLSKRAQEKEFAKLTAAEISAIEQKYALTWGHNNTQINTTHPLAV